MAIHLPSIFFASRLLGRLSGTVVLCGLVSGCNEMGDDIARYAKERKAVKERSIGNAREKALAKSVVLLSPGDIASPFDRNSPRVLAKIEAPRPVKTTRMREPGAMRVAKGASFVLPVLTATEENSISYEMTGSLKK